jgi:hypothetical protein
MTARSMWLASGLGILLGTPAAAAPPAEEEARELGQRRQRSGCCSVIASRRRSPSLRRKPQCSKGEGYGRGRVVRG